MEAVSFIALTVSIISILVTVWNVNRSNRLTKQNHQARVFNECTRRYQDILMRMPDEMVMYSDLFDASVLKYMTAYFDLCSEEFHLHYKGDITDEVWKIWVEGMQLTTRPDIYRSCWKVLSSTYNEKFVHFMHSQILNPEKNDNY